MDSCSESERLHKCYLVYKAIYDLPFKAQRKNTLLTPLSGCCFDYPWRVTGITIGALEVLASNNYRYVKGICRAHRVARIETAHEVFKTPQPLPEDQFLNVIWENDETVIATKSENKRGGILPEPITIDYKLGMFQGNLQVGWKHGKTEADFLRKLHMKYKASKAGE